MPTFTTTSIRPLLYNSVAEAVFNEIISRSGRYYYFLGKILEWSNELTPPKALDSVYFEKDTRRHIVIAREIRPGEVSLVVDRRDWTEGTVYDMYDDRYSDEVVGVDIVAGGSSYSSNTFITFSGGNGVGAIGNVILGSGSIIGVTMADNGYGYNTKPTISIVDLDGYGSGANLQSVLNYAYSGSNNLSTANFYVVNDEFNIYKCLDNNGNSPSTIQPVDTPVEPFVTSDGYKWKFIGTVPPSLKNKFMSGETMPVSSTLTKNFYSNGEIKRIVINNTGDNYTAASITVDGDGFLESDPVYIVAATILNPGSGYTTANAIIDPPVNYSNTWASTTYYNAGTRLRSGNNIYQAITTGISGISNPVHTTGSVYNGNVNFKYLGTVATANVSVAGGNVTSISFFGVVKGITVDVGGTGYTAAPPVVISGGGGSGAEAYSTLNGNSLSTITLTDIGTGYTSAPTVTIGTAWAANTRTALGAQVSNGGRLYTVAAANSNFRITDIKYDNYTANISSLFANVRGVALNKTGTALYVTGSNTNTVSQFTLTTPYRASNPQANGNISIAAFDTQPQDLAFSYSGNVMFVIGSQNDKVYRFNLANSWNVRSAAYVSNLNIAPYETDPTCLFIDNAGLKLFISGTSSDKIQTFNLSTPWDITTASVGSNVSIAGYEANISGLFFNSTGKILSIVGTSSKQISQFYLSNAWDVTTISYFGSYPVDSFDSQPTGIHYDETSDKIYVLGDTTKSTYQFSMPKTAYFGVTGPTHSSGNVFSGDALLQYSGNAAVASATLKYGSGYTTFPNIIIGGNGVNATANVSVLKSEAIVYPVIEGGKIVRAAVADGGIGYTYAILTVTGDGANASLIADISEGDVTTIQGNNELLSQDGAIEAIKIISGGYNYSTANVTIIGNGTGATANATVEGGRVIKITVDTAGEGYTFADVIIQGDGKGASARAIFPPFGGHGRDIVSELYARSLAMYTTIANEPNQGFNVVNEYRQFGLIKDLEKFDSNGYFKGVTGSGCYIITGNTASTLIVDDAILTSSRNADYLIVAHNDTSALVIALDAIDPRVGDTMSLNGTALFSVTSVVNPDINKYSGKLLYVDNREAFTTSGQTITIKTVFKY